MFLVIMNILNDQDRSIMVSLYDKYIALIYCQAKKLIENPVDTEDIVQQVLLRLIENIPIIKTLDEIVMPVYITVVTKRLCFDFLKCYNYKNMSVFSDYPEYFEDQLESIESPEDNVCNVLSFNDLCESIKQVNDRDMFLLYTKYCQELTDNEIADFLNVNPSSVRSLLSRARKRAKIAIEANLNETL